MSRGRTAPTSGAPGRAVGVLLALLALPIGAHAQTSSLPPAAFDAQLFHPTPDAAGLLGVMMEKTPGHLSIATGVWFDLAFNPLRVGVPSLELPKATLVTRRFDTHLISTVGIGRQLELGLELPIVVYQGGNDSPFARQVLNFDGFKAGRLGDLTLHGKYTVLNEQGSRPGVAAGVNLRLPTGQENDLAGEASAVFEPFAAVAKRYGPHAGAVNLGLLIRPKAEVLGDFEIGSQLLYAAGISYATGNPGTEQTSAFVAELAGQLPLGGTKSGVATLEGRVAMRYAATRNPYPISVAPGLGIGLLRGYGQPLVRVLLAVDFVTQDPVLDTDKDGVPDIYDQCPTQPEDKDGFEDADGCPDPDNDGDKIADEDDDCPNEAGPRSTDGCPIGNEPDADNDGVPDSGDKCPQEAEDYDGFQDEDGCPDPDNDKDGIPDYGDMCPDAAEDKNGFQDDDGCPDGGKSARFVTLLPDNVQLSRPLAFDKEGAELSPASKQILDQVATLMRDHLEIAWVKMLVHPERKNPKSRAIAASRAASIFKYLASRGVEGERLRIEDGAFDRRNAGQVEISAKVDKVDRVAPPPKAAPPKAPPSKHKKRR